ncbi:DUF6255 family natural product biosynthesis protein [Streptomyces stramineus]
MPPPVRLGTETGEARCRTCGVVRFTDYGALRPQEMPQVVTPSARSTYWADRAAAHWISQIARRATWWGLGVRGGGASAGR